MYSNEAGPVAGSRARLIVFADHRAIAARVLLPELLQRISGGDRWHSVRVYLSAPQNPRRERLAHRLQRGVRLLQICLGSGKFDASVRVAPLRSLTQCEVPVAPLPVNREGGFDTDALLDELPSADYAINLYCQIRFPVALLARFRAVLNYHNGALPAYRGLRASNWSLYNGDSSSSFSFHYMDEGLDTGPVLLAGEIEVQPGITPADLELAKAQRAAGLVDDVLERLHGGASGEPQSSAGILYTRQMYERIVSIDQPGEIDFAEWQRRLAAFLRVKTRLGGAWITVTGIARCGPGQLAHFRTRDGEPVRVTAVNFWPPAPWRLRM